MVEIIKNVFPQSRVKLQCVSFDVFWSHSRFKAFVNGVDTSEIVCESFKEMEMNGGFATFLELKIDGKVVGSLVVFKDPFYRSKGRDDVVCFGLVTALRARDLEPLLDRALHETRSHGYHVLRGPVNAPRFLFGYGVEISGFEWPIVAGTSSDPPAYAKMFGELEERGFFNGRDKYLNCIQDFDKTNENIAAIDLDRNFRIVNPDLDDCGKLLEKIALMMNETLGYRPDYQIASLDKLEKAAQLYKLVPGAEKLIGLFFDDEVFAGAVLMQPDWFQAFAGKSVTTIIGDIFMLGKAYQGRKLLLNFSEYTGQTLAALGAQYYEHASIWEHTDAITAWIKIDCLKIIREFLVFEMRC
ncbi:MAG TPA: hypothetical protein VKM55_24210 [Candidatus Lokiarchaeia archaeon]|nr:hypothetical protein [Candidatus Lokiarchaeia archaeon]